MSWPKYKGVALGHSQTDYLNVMGDRPARTWPAVLERALRAQSADVEMRSFGKAGDTTAQLLARLDIAAMYGVPDFAVIDIGVNDPGASISQATTQANIQAMLKALKYGAWGSPGQAGGTQAPGAGFGGPPTVATETSLPAYGAPGQRYVVLADGSTTGGAAAANPNDAATITGSISGAQSVWEYRNPQAGVFGWGRVAVAATTPTAVKRIIVLSTNYLNFTTGGDSPATPYSTYATVRAAQLAAVAVENVNIAGVPSVIYADEYGLYKARVVAGTDPNFSADTSIVGTTAYTQARSPHYIQDNQHRSEYGHWLPVQAILNGGPAGTSFPSKWLTDLSS